MDKLTLENLAPFLPYGVHAQSKNADFIITGATTEEVIGDNELGEQTWDYDEVKLMLRPMSYLTKEIDHNGNKFVPLVELFCIRYNRESFDIVEIKDNYMRISWDKVRSRIDTFMYSESTQSFVFINQESGKQYRIPYQLGMFKKMYSWYFDVDDLIGCDLAIDINSIEGKETKGNG